MLVQAAADQWKVKPAECRAEKGFVIGPGGKRASYGQLAGAASKLPVPEQVALKDPKDFQVIGKPTRRLDSADKVEGRATFGIDVKRPNRVHVAVVAHAPVFGGGVKSFNAEKVKAVSGVTHVIELAHGVAVVATNFWAAKKGRDQLDVNWDLGANATISSDALRTQFLELAKTPGLPVKKAADAEAMKRAAKTIVAEYDVPFLAHAPMEPLNCTVEVTGDRAEIWVGSQLQTVDQANAARVLGIKPENVTLHTMFAGGGFGRRANPVSDYITEACIIAQNAKVPVKTIWTREDDIRGGYYRPLMVHRAEIGLDAQGAVVGWNHAIAGPSIIGGTAFEPMLVKDGIDATSTEGVGDTPYAIPNMAVSLNTVKIGVPVLWWRSVGHGAEEGSGAAAARAPREESADAEGAGGRGVEVRLGIGAAQGHRAWRRDPRVVRKRVRACGRSLAGRRPAASAPDDHGFRLRAGGESVDCRGAATKRGGFRALGGALQQDHVEGREGRAVELPRLPGAAHERDAAGRGAPGGRRRQADRRGRARCSAGRARGRQRALRAHRQASPFAATRLGIEIASPWAHVLTQTVTLSRGTPLEMWRS